MYHVYFLNDCNRVYWMRHEYILAFNGRDAMKQHLIKIREEVRVCRAWKYFNLWMSETSFQSFIALSYQNCWLNTSFCLV